MLPLRIIRIDWPWPGYELVRPDGTGWPLLRLPDVRWRIVSRTWPRPGLYIADTPCPNCPDCEGLGSWPRDYGHPETGEYDGTEDVLCACWDEQLAVLLLPFGRRRPRQPLFADRLASSHSAEPPF